MAVGELLRYWRAARHLSQLALATEASTSPRHLSFIETGRANPSREMVLRLADVLDVPLRDRNALLLAAGFAPQYRESPLAAPALAAVRGAIDAILRQQEPFPAVVMDRRWDIVRVNAAALRFFGAFLGAEVAAGPGNVLRMMFDPTLMRPLVVNWGEVAESLIRRVRREAVGGVVDATARELLAELRGYPGVDALWQSANPSTPLLPVVPVSFQRRAGEPRYDFFSTVTTLGTPLDIAAQELRIECFFPTNPATERAARDLAAAAD